MVHFRSVLKDIKQRGHIVKLFHDLHILAVIEENTGGVGCKCGEFIRQDTNLRWGSVLPDIPAAFAAARFGFPC